MLNFIILTQSRTGSDLLATSLNSHPDLKVATEVFHKDMELAEYNIREVGLEWSAYDLLTLRKRDFLEYLFANTNGCKVFYDNFYFLPSEFFIQERPNLKVIQLIRRNSLRRLISFKLAEKSNVFQVNPGVSFYNDQPVEIDIDEAWNAFNIDKISVKQTHAAFSGRVLDVYYEDLVENWSQEMDRIQVFLGIKSINLSQTRGKRTDPRNYRRMVGNWEELFKEFNGTQYQGFFDDVLAEKRNAMKTRRSFLSCVAVGAILACGGEFTTPTKTQMIQEQVFRGQVIDGCNRHFVNCTFIRSAIKGRVAGLDDCTIWGCHPSCDAFVYMYPD